MATKPKYKVKKEAVDVFGAFALEGPLRDVMQLFEEIIIDHPNHSNFTLAWDSGDSDGGGSEYTVWGERLETEEEYQKRLSSEKKARLQKAKLRAKHEDQQRDLYEKLKKKFENKKTT